MSVSPEPSTGGDNVALLLRAVYEARADARRWRQRSEWMEKSRDRWRREAKAWKWGALHGGIR